jgi:hypothetical protein
MQYAPLDLDGITVLIVDDDPDARDILARKRRRLRDHRIIGGRSLGDFKGRKTRPVD